MTQARLPSQAVFVCYTSFTPPNGSGQSVPSQLRLGGFFISCRTPEHSFICAILDAYRILVVCNASRAMWIHLVPGGVLFISHEYKSPNTSSREGAAIRCIILHATVGSLKSAIDWLTNPATEVSSHYLIGKDGAIYQLVPDELRAHHAGKSAWRGTADVNDFSIGIELENRNDGHDPYPPAQLNALRELTSGLLTAYNLTPDAIDTHAAVALPAKRKSDPAGFDLDAFRASLATPPAPRYTSDSPILGSPLAPRLVFSGARGEYTVYDVRIITNAYWTQSLSVGIDPILAFSQCLHETARLLSWWAARPRRNAAGIGVTGETRIAAKAPGPDWAYDERVKLWRAGVSFRTWADHSIPAHLGRLLGYALHPKEMTDAQLALYRRAIAVRPLPPQYLGCAPTLQGLEDTWATDGDPTTESFYADAIARQANALVEEAT